MFGVSPGGDQPLEKGKESKKLKYKGFPASKEGDYPQNTLL